MTLLYIQSGHFQTASFSLGLRLNETICKPPRRGISDSYTTSGPLDSSPLAFLSQLFGLSPLQCSSQDWVLDVGTNPSLCQEKYWTCNIPSYFMLLHKRWNFWQDCVPASPTHLDVVFYPLCGKAVHVLFRYILVESDPYVAANLVCPWKEVTRDLPTPPSCESPSSWNFNYESCPHCISNSSSITVYIFLTWFLLQWHFLLCQAVILYICLSFQF